MHRVHLPQRRPTDSGSPRRLGGGSCSTSILARIEARKSQLPCLREMSIEFLPMNPIPAFAAHARSSTGPVSTEYL
jgi:hypothetical protein